MIPCIIALYFSNDWNRKGRQIKITQWRLGLFRGVFVALAQLCLYTSYAYLPFALVATMEYTGPMMVTLLAIPILGEKFGWYKISAVISGFAGIVLIMQPWSSDFNYMLLLPILAAFGYSLARTTSLSFEDSVPSPLINLYGQTGTIVVACLLVLILSLIHI